MGRGRHKGVAEDLEQQQCEKPSARSGKMSLIRKACCVGANIILVIAIAIFAVGFFPHKAVLPGLAKWSDDSLRVHNPAPFDRVIFMVVDALRSDFVYSNTSFFHFTQSLIRSGAAIPFTAHASPPTITMPRVKAITTGSVPSFLDLVLNFAESDTSSTLALQDSWLAQLKADGRGKLVMYGDDTWLRLFPGFFDRHDGTTSFFVSDFTEVDNNVTRHIPEELKRDDWSGMILHFLGLDHIGHKTGPKGPKMPAKQMEMDSIVKTIYHEMESEPHLQNCLLVLLGDHGMNDAGNHGASSAGEVSTALTFISPTFQKMSAGRHCPISDVDGYHYYDRVEQSDIAPTLGVLLGFPIPLNNLGVIIRPLLDFWTSDFDKMLLLFQNAAQIYDIASATFPSAFQDFHPDSCKRSSLKDAELLGCSWYQARLASDDARVDEARTKTAITEIRIFLNHAQDTLSGTASTYGLKEMYTGIFLAFVALLFSSFAAGKFFASFGPAQLFFVLIILLYAITMFASSYVEEEHQFWYWALSGWLTILCCKFSRFYNPKKQVRGQIFAILGLLFGLVRRWNQTGQKYAGDPDVVSEIFIKHPWFLWLLVIATYAIVGLYLNYHISQWGFGKPSLVLLSLICVASLYFKVAFTEADAPELLESTPLLITVSRLPPQLPLVYLARTVFAGIALLLVLALAYETPWKDQRTLRQFDRFFNILLSLFLITQTRTVNIPMFLIFFIQHYQLCHLENLNDTEVTITSLLLEYSSFFALGGTNAISSVDLSNAYNGVSGYNAGAVGLLTFISNWAGPIWWVSAISVLQRSRREGVAASQNASSHFALLTLYTALSTFAVMLACTVLREHLFIWTVFSPKYLYCIAWVLAFHVGINGLFALYGSIG